MVNGKFLAIDAHCHIYPEKIAARAVGGTDNFYGVHSTADGTVRQLKQMGAEAGIDRFVVQSVATTPKQVRSINDFIACEVAADSTLTGLGTLHPDSTDLKGDVQHIIELGLRGVKLHPDIQQFKIDDHRCLKIYELCEREGLPILMHTGDYRYDYSNPNRLLPVMQIYSGLTVVGAHFGGWSVWDEAAEKLSGLPNLYVDCSSSMPFIGGDKVRRLIERFTPDKVLFGTDYPMWSPKSEMDCFMSLGLSDEDYRKMLSLNACKIYGIEL